MMISWGTGSLIQFELYETEKGKWSKSFSFIKGKSLNSNSPGEAGRMKHLTMTVQLRLIITINVSSDTSVTYKIKLWADQVERKIEGQITGTVKYHRNFSGRGNQAERCNRLASSRI